ncbi:MAG: ATP-dependent Clp protease adaptor ClpS [Planctomycetia bacterium]|nr:ATP-dependent Clp protease adaptor ClpS [Planctomycetia bacterium]
MLRNRIVASDAAVATPEVAEPAVEEVPQAAPHQAVDEKKPRPKRQPRYHVVLWNDDDHSYGYVMTMLQELFGHPLEKGFQLAKEVDVAGKAIVLTTTMEHAELKRDQIKAYGKDPDIRACKGSMSSSIEPAPE